MWWVELGWPPGVHYIAFLLTLLTAEENTIIQLTGWGRWLTDLHHGQNRLSLRKINLIYCQWELKASWKHLSPTPLWPPHPEWFRGVRNGSCGQFIMPCLCRSFLLILFFCSGILSTGFVSSETRFGSSQTDPVWASHRQQFLKNCSNMVPYHKVHISGIDCSSMCSPGAVAPDRKPAPVWASLHGLQYPPAVVWSPPRAVLRDMV